VKIEGMGPQVSHSDLLAVLGNLSEKLVEGGHVGAKAFATAGFRLVPDAAHKTWQRIRDWNEDHKLFDSCSRAETEGCQTLAGSDEAALEMKGMIDDARRDHVALSPRFGVASCGGASIQLGFWGAPKAELAGCIEDLGRLSSHYDKARTHLRSDKKGAFFSWLANHYAPLSVEGRSDYGVGGVDEMRDRYDSWLLLEEEKTNPCISPDADSYHSTGGVCEQFLGKGKKCLKDGWGSYITRLPGRPFLEQWYGRQICRQSVRSFLQDDAMLSAWHSSTACRAIAAKTPEWEFLSAFSRKSQLGASVKDVKTWATVRESLHKERASTFETPDELKAHNPGRYLTSVLLISFLERIGLNSSATVQASKADVASVKMTGHGFSKGWVTKCAPKDPVIVSACSVPPSMEAHKSGPYSINDTVTVHCGPGFAYPRQDQDRVRKNWKLKCRDLHTWEVVPETGATDASEARDKPACKAIFCKSPLDVLGVWLGPSGYNDTLRLKCADGYKPSHGQSSLLCLDGGSFKNFARCIAIGSITGTWRRNVFLNGLFSLVGLAVVLVVVVAACWREPPFKVSTQRTESQPLQERHAATMDME